MELKEHWNNCYSKSDVDKLGWYEEESQPSLDLIKSYSPDKSSRILLAGIGASTLIDSLLECGYNNLIATDISENALSLAKDRLKDRAKDVEWIVDDLIKPKKLIYIDGIDLWQDRAVLHFFTKEEDRLAYFSLLKKLLKPSGHALIATFSSNESAEKCSNLPVFKYDSTALNNYMGQELHQLESFEQLYTMPSGDQRNYHYGLYRKAL